MLSRILARFAVVAVTLGLLTVAATAQDKWPSRPVTIIVPFAAGGNTDVMARIFAEQLTKRLGQQFVVENRPGAGGVNGLHAMTRGVPRFRPASADPDCRDRGDFHSCCDIPISRHVRC